MASRWMSERFRAEWVGANSCFILLGLLTEASSTEREILGQFYDRFGSVPSAKDFRSMIKALSDGGLIEVESGGRSRSLKIRRPGLLLLERLRAENRQILSVLAD